MCLWKVNENLKINIEVISEKTCFILRFTMTIPSFYSIKKIKNKIIEYIKPRCNCEVYLFYILIKNNGHLYGWKILEKTHELQHDTTIRVLCQA